MSEIQTNYYPLSLMMLYSLAVTFVILATASVAQHCQPYDPANAPASRDVCPPFLNDLIWSPLPISIVDWVLNSTSLWRIKAVQPITPTACYQHLLSLSCNTAFQPCQDVFIPELNNTVALATPPCKSVCEYTNHICGPFWKNVNQTLIDCNQTSPLTGLEKWPVGYLVTEVNGILINSTCLSELPLPKVALASTCPYPLTAVDNPSDSEPPCNMPCPDPVYNPRQWHTLSVAIDVCATLSFSLMMLLCLLYVTNPYYRTCSKRIFLHSFFAQMMLALGMVIGGTDPSHKVWCIRDTEYATIRHPPCAIQGFLFVFFGLSAGIWMVASATMVYLRLFVVQFRITSKQEITCLSVAYGIPLCLYVVPAQLGLMNAYWRVPMCFVEGYIDNGTVAYHYLFFYIPVGICLITTIGLLTAIIIRLSLHKWSLNRSFQVMHLKDGGRSIAKMNRRLLFWCLSLIYIFVMLLVYRLKMGDKRTLEAWIICKVRSQLGLGSSFECPEATLPELVSFEFTLAHYMIISSLGVLSFLVSGTEIKLYLFWRDVLECMWARDWSQVCTLLTTIKKQRSKRGGGRASIKLPQRNTGLSPSPSSSLPSDSNTTSINTTPPPTIPLPCRSITISQDDTSTSHVDHS